MEKTGIISHPVGVSFVNEHLGDYVRNLANNSSSFDRSFDLDGERVIVLDYGLARIVTLRILKHHRIPHVMFSDLTDDQDATELQSACST
ncbi:hypothetical protein RND71_004172 [Anisodus tanguticus]|uniref:Uncharacterized protein n=1 Tax=Anisodus tanguticus TaxID=243964 RepID=A0AAE1VUN9_9SOLA|nr:hypothetical protein RND71_004172 [Anisodus tanguticus]